MKLKSFVLAFALLCIPPFGGSMAGEHKRENSFTLDEAVSKVRTQTRGRILSAKTVDHNGAYTHHIRVLTQDGRVQRFQLKARKKGGRPLSRRRR